MSDPILTTTSEKVTTVTLNRPESLNALSNEMRKTLVDLFVRLRDDDNTRVIVLTGNGRAFTAGLDIKELGQSGFAEHGESITAIDLENAIGAVGKPVIGAINGFAITGGFELALMCDILIAGPDAQFADTHVRMGVVPGWGLSQKLPRLIGISRAKELSLTGNFLDAETAERWGLVNRIVPQDKLLAHCQQLAEDICSADPATVTEVRRLIDFGWAHTLAEGRAEEKRASNNHKQRLTPGILEENRNKVQSRGRDQKSK